METARRVYVLGAPVDVLELQQAVAHIEHWIAQGCATRFVAVTSSHGIILAHRNPAFKQILRSADLSLPDGRWTARAAARKAGLPTRQVRGAVLLEQLCHMASRRGYPVFFYGDTETTLRACCQRLKQMFPRLPIAGWISPPFRPLTEDEQAALLEQIRAARPALLLVALGTPKQERWIAAYRDRLGVPVAVGIGAAVKFLAGLVRTAPEWVSRSGLEWVWRLFQEPKRVWHRALVLGPQFAAHTLLDVYGLRRYE